MEYCKTTTVSHFRAIEFGNIVVNINDLLEEEGCDEKLPLFSKSEVVLNLDKMEEEYSLSIGRLEKAKSMDLAFGLVDQKNIEKKQMLLVELKFRMVSFYGLSKQSMEEKVTGSSSVLLNTPPIYNQFIFVFKSSHLQEAISRICRMVPKLDSKFIALDINLLKERFFSA